MGQALRHVIDLPTARSDKRNKSDRRGAARAWHHDRSVRRTNDKTSRSVPPARIPPLHTVPTQAAVQALVRRSVLPPGVPAAGLPLTQPQSSWLGLAATRYQSARRDSAQRLVRNPASEHSMLV